MSPFEIGGQKVLPGTRERILLELPNLYVQVPIPLYLVVVHGVRPGPVLWVNSCIHGDEINSLFIVKRVLKKLQPHKLAGTLLTLPFVNIFGVIHQSRYLPDRRDLNRSFPGSAKGSLASSVAHIFMKEIVKRADYGIDLHTAAVHRNNMPQVRANLEDPKTYHLSKAFAAPLMIHANVRDGSLRQAANNLGKVCLLYEGGPALRHNEEATRIGTDGVFNVLRALKMYPGPSRKKQAATLDSRYTKWVRAPRSGFFVCTTKLGKRVKKGQVLGTLHLRIHRQFFTETETPIIAPFTGVVIGYTENPMVYQGEALVHLAKIGNTKK